MDRWAARRQARLDEIGRIHRDDPNWSKRNAATPGPEWAHAISGIPVIGLIGDLAIGIDAQRRRDREGK